MAGAERRSDLAQRSLVGVALAAGALLALWLGGTLVWTLLLVVALVALVEWGALVRAHRVRLGLGLFVLLVGMSYAMPLLWGADRATLALLLIPAMLLALFPKAAAMALGAGYIGTAAIAVLFLRAQPLGFALALWMLTVVVATDVGAYFAGRTLGGPKLAPSISPSKTWAGLAGGMATATVAGALVAIPGHLPFRALWLAPLLAIVAQLGDLLESGMKRRAGLKDSGRLLPGHGGALDRIDGMLPVAILTAALVANGNL